MLLKKIFHQYTLETFNEKRGLVCQYVNCRPGESIDPPGTAPYPNVWSLGCMPSNNFRNEVKRLNYPHTDVIQVFKIGSSK